MIPGPRLTFSHALGILGHFWALPEHIVYSLIITTANYYGLLFSQSHFLLGNMAKPRPVELAMTTGRKLINLIYGIGQTACRLDQNLVAVIVLPPEFMFKQSFRLIILRQTGEGQPKVLKRSSRVAASRW
jgi:hypothetical protein